MENKDPLENDDSWVEFIDDDPLEKDIVEIPLEELQDEEFADDEEEAEEETEEYKDDFEDDFKFDDKFEYDDDDHWRRRGRRTRRKTNKDIHARRKAARFFVIS